MHSANVKRASTMSAAWINLALITDKLAPDMVLYREHAGHIVELLTEFFADALELAVADEAGIVRLMAYLSTK